MKTFWKTHPALRIMLVGVALLLAVLAIYNATYQD